MAKRPVIHQWIESISGGASYQPAVALRRTNAQKQPVPATLQRKASNVKKKEPRIHSHEGGFFIT
jgi:hypothetical protein